MDDPLLGLMADVARLSRLTESKPVAETTTAKRHIRDLLKGKRKSVPLSSLMLLSSCDDPMPEWASSAFDVEARITYSQAIEKLGRVEHD